MKRGCLLHGSYFCAGLRDLLLFTSRHVHLALLKFSPLGMKHISLREDAKSFSLIDPFTRHLCTEVAILAIFMLSTKHAPFIRI